MARSWVTNDACPLTSLELRPGENSAGFPRSSAVTMKAITTFIPFLNTSLLCEFNLSVRTGQFGTTSPQVICITANKERIEFPWGQLAQFKVAQNSAESVKASAGIFIRNPLPKLVPTLNVRYDAVFTTESEG